jgi:hypothetical protein
VSEFGPVQSKNDSGFIIGLLGLILAVGGLMYADEQTRLARVQTMHAEEQTRLAKIARDEAEEQARKKLRDVRFVPDVCYIRSSDGPWRWITFTLINSGEVDLDPNEFEVGPLIEFENPVIADYKVNTYGLPGRVKKDQNRVTLFFEAQFRTTDRVILNVLCKGEPGQINTSLV